MTTWVPQSCTLPTAERPLRVAEFDTLFAEHLADVHRPEKLRLHLVLAGGEGVEATVRDLVARESGCCSFFTFTVAHEAERILLNVTVDDAHEGVLDALHARAAVAADRDLS